MTTELAFHETLQGAFAWGQTDPETGALEGAKAGTAFGFDGTITMTDLDRFIRDPTHKAGFDGTYLGNLFTSAGRPQPTLVSATFNFMEAGAGAPRLMVHEHTLRSGNDTFTLKGTKYLAGQPLALNTVHDLTTLYTTLTDQAGAVVGAGVLRFPMRDFPDLVSSFESSGDDDPLTAKMKFLKLFLHEELYVLLTGFRATPVPAEVRRALARPAAQRRDRYDVVVIGSGYGGGVAAARLSAAVPGKAKRSVCVIERGRELRAGDFPSEPWQLAGEVRTAVTPKGLFEYVDAGDVETVVGNGLGGTSLINANVMLRAEPAVFREAPWPRALPDLTPYYDRAVDMLKPTPHPSPPVKAQVLRDAVRAVAAETGEPAPPVDTVPIAVNFTPGFVRADTGNTQDACINCGACVSGCNVTAKSTVDMTYLSVAEKQGAEIFVETEVVAIQDDPQSGELRVHVRDLGGNASVIAAKQVVLAAGTLGSFRVLRQSADAQGLVVSRALGTRFSGNGDILGFGYDTREPADPRVGPTITTRVAYTTDPDVRNHFILEDGGVPQAVDALLRAALPFVDKAPPPQDHGFFHQVRDWLRTGADFVGLTSHGALRRSVMYFGMGTETDTGTLRLDDGAVKVTWPGVANERFATRMDARMRDLTFAIGGSYVKNPDPRSFLREKFITAHPLGGCPMGDDPLTSVVDVDGAVFGYEGRLFVADGSILPTPVGLNPALTIAALAEHIAAKIVAAW
jgi:cholesterol oxidase